MGFSGGSSNVTKAHTHSSSIVQDGGALNFSNVTQAGMAAGDITYSNGTALQVLGLGSATDTLTVNAGATAPEWASGGGGGNYVHVESFTQGVSASTFDCTLADTIAVSEISEIVVVYSGRYSNTGSAGLEMQVMTNNNQPITNNGYSWGFIDFMTGSNTTGVDQTYFLVGPNTSSGGTISTIITHLSCSPHSVHGGVFRRIECNWTMAGLNIVSTTGGGGTYDDAEVTSFDGVLFTNSAGNQIDSTSTVDIYKVTV